MNTETTEAQLRFEDFDWNALNRGFRTRDGDLKRVGNRLSAHNPRRVGAGIIVLVFSCLSGGLSSGVGASEFSGPSLNKPSVFNKSVSAAKEARPSGYTQGTQHRKPAPPILLKASAPAKDGVQSRTTGPAGLGGPSWSVKHNPALSGLNGTTAKRKP